MTSNKFTLAEKQNNVSRYSANPVLRHLLTLDYNRITTLSYSALLFILIPFFSQAQKITSFKDGIGDKFYTGAALNVPQTIVGNDTTIQNIITEHFNAIVSGNTMKSGWLQRKKGEFNFNWADAFVDFGEQNDMFITGHTLVWHSQAPKWFFTDDDGNQVSREEMIRRMRDHIYTVVGRYKGRIDTWDVVNEAIEDDGSWRESKFYKIIGEDFIKLAFQFAHEADPEAELYYNDYSMSNPGRRAGVVAMVKSLQEAGIPIHGIGMQGHLGLDYPSLDEFEKSILAFSELGLKVSITELDITVLPSPWGDMGADVSTNVSYEERMNPYPDGLPKKVQKKFDQRYLDLYKLFLKHEDKIDRVTLWGVTDDHSWKNNWPIKGRTDYPLLFDRENQPKAVVQEIIDLYQK
ncbi:endo-1,4-beta-xylanase [Reichenbachiella sp. MSK19-1]|uniref:Beta-xylanase n=1 Tax=Reichenbachiella agariperforans TaxID=156994 RepID=A0A1M6KDT6_REIAG|nr:endo-1,4-beta-xylanase [Reichenbachiella sp. MSK19-1]SHJ57104.1 endo-1,4-beta-xylanase [Reichenbachiella agariperforans]